MAASEPSNWAAGQIRLMQAQPEALVRLWVGADCLRPTSIGLPGATPAGAGHRAQSLALSRDPRHLDLISNPFSLLYRW